MNYGHRGKIVESMNHLADVLRLKDEKLETDKRPPSDYHFKHVARDLQTLAIQAQVAIHEVDIARRELIERECAICYMQKEYESRIDDLLRRMSELSEENKRLNSVDSF